MGRDVALERGELLTGHEREDFRDRMKLHGHVASLHGQI
jgi:hypothetical protein